MIIIQYPAGGEYVSISARYLSLSAAASFSHLALSFSDNALNSTDANLDCDIVCEYGKMGMRCNEVDECIKLISV